MIKPEGKKGNRPTARRRGLRARPNVKEDSRGDFANRVFEVVRSIPRGQVMTYHEVARAAGSSRAYRAVGNVLRQNYDPEIPCHRVIRSDGRVGDYNRGSSEKIRLLKDENVTTFIFPYIK